MGVGAGLYMYVVVVQKFTFAISSPDEFLFCVSFDTKYVISVLPSQSLGARMTEDIKSSTSKANKTQEQSSLN